MIGFFRIVALIEGVTTLALFLVAMPVKYMLGNPVLVPPIGWTHGMAFLLYLAVMVVALAWARAPFWGWVRSFIASLFPFGTFLNDPYLKRLQAARAR